MYSYKLGLMFSRQITIKVLSSYYNKIQPFIISRPLKLQQ